VYPDQRNMLSAIRTDFVVAGQDGAYGARATTLD
jgi:hypothetical protein